MKSALSLLIPLCLLAARAACADSTLPVLPEQAAVLSGKRISVDFQNIEIRTVLQLLSKESGLNIVADDRVKGRITLTLNRMPLNQVLALILHTRNLGMRQLGNTLLIVPAADGQTASPTFYAAPSTRYFVLKYRRAEDIARLLDGKSDGKEPSAGLLSTRGSVRADAASNTLIVTDRPEGLHKAAELIGRLDIPAQQVVIEARIVEASEGVSRDLGVKFGFSGVNSRYAWSNTLDNAQANRHAYQDFRNHASPDIRYALGANVNLPVAAATSGIALIRAVSSGALGLELAAQQAQNRARILSAPRILTQNRKEAIIESGTEVPYEESTSGGATSVNFKKAVLGLKVTPHITPDRRIMMDIQVNKDSVDGGCTASEPCIRTQRLNTGAMVEDGGTLVIGGIYEESDSNAVRKVPLLGDIPYVGNLFKYRSRNQGRSELLVFITPHIVGHNGPTPETGKEPNGR